MQYRRFGRTELQMPVFSCGGMRYQHKWKDVAPEEIPAEAQANLEATIRRALELGINHIETARGYGTSEMQLGRILPTLKRDELIVQTKVAPFEDAGKFRHIFNKSMEYLKLEYVDLFSLHGVNTAELLEWCLRPGGCLEEARKFQKEGRVRHIGFSTHAPLPVILRAIETGEFDYVNLHWYYIHQLNWPAVEAATRHDMGVFIISPSDKGGHLYRPPSRLVELCEPLSPIVFNDLFCLSRPEVHTLSIGAARPGDFDEHVKTLGVLDRAAELLPAIERRLEEAARERLGEAWLRTWHEGLPEYGEAPGGLNIPVLLWLRNLALGWDMVEYAKARYNLLGNGGHWFPGEKPDKLEEVDLAECLAASPHREAIPGMLREVRDLLKGEAVQRMTST
jgi:uncharacterized protein